MMVEGWVESVSIPPLCGRLMDPCRPHLPRSPAPLSLFFTSTPSLAPSQRTDGAFSSSVSPWLTCPVGEARERIGGEDTVIYVLQALCVCVCGYVFVCVCA